MAGGLARVWPAGVRSILEGGIPASLLPCFGLIGGRIGPRPQASLGAGTPSVASSAARAGGRRCWGLVFFGGADGFLKGSGLEPRVGPVLPEISWPAGG
ncbi:hypothetical protein NDU88_009845 [Pleurodeles waltl]|uniref:Uncharacterized protein n=1 Tax=Pleurodeles waltl TaxID=8319 RepID=A0AAV7QVT8_PLEWA|nr:hypothetical protein NDU88_009845 [Pleurodeles waltl]